VDAAQASTARRGLGSTAIEAVEDVVGLALEQALEQHAALAGTQRGGAPVDGRARRKWRRCCSDAVSR
jgi:hypothetical protein